MIAIFSVLGIYGGIVVDGAIMLLAIVVLFVLAILWRAFLALAERLWAGVVGFVCWLGGVPRILPVQATEYRRVFVVAGTTDARRTALVPAPPSDPLAAMRN